MYYLQSLQMSRQLRGAQRALIFQSPLYIFEPGGQAGQDLTVRLLCQQLERGQEDAYLNTISLTELFFRWMKETEGERKTERNLERDISRTCCCVWWRVGRTLLKFVHSCSSWASRLRRPGASPSVSCSICAPERSAEAFCAERHSSSLKNSYNTQIIPHSYLGILGMTHTVWSCFICVKKKKNLIIFTMSWVKTVLESKRPESEKLFHFRTCSWAWRIHSSSSVESRWNLHIQTH